MVIIWFPQGFQNGASVTASQQIVSPFTGLTADTRVKRNSGYWYAETFGIA